MVLMSFSSSMVGEKTRIDCGVVGVAGSRSAEVPIEVRLWCNCEDLGEADRRMPERLEIDRLWPNAEGRRPLGVIW